MVTRVGKFLGGLGQDVTNTVNAHATENRIAFGAAINPAANVQVVGNVHVSTSVHAGSGFTVPNDGDIGSLGATDAIQIDSAGIVTFKDDIKIKNDGTIGSAGAATAMTIDSSGIVTFVDDIKIKNDGTIGSAGAATAMTIDSGGIVTFVDDIKIKDGGTIGVASKADAITIASDGKATLVDDLAVTGNITSTLQTVVTTGLGVAGNTAPAATGVSLGTPANLVIRTHAASGKGNVIIGDATATSSYNLDVRGSANVGAFTASGLSYPTSDGSDGQVISTDGSGALTFSTVSTSVDPATVLATNTDCGNFDEETNDAFGQIITDNVTVLNLLVDKTDQLGTVDMGALS